MVEAMSDANHLFLDQHLILLEFKDVFPEEIREILWSKMDFLRKIIK